MSNYFFFWYAPATETNKDTFSHALHLNLLTVRVWEKENGFLFLFALVCLVVLLLFWAYKCWEPVLNTLARLTRRAVRCTCGEKAARVQTGPESASRVAVSHLANIFFMSELFHPTTTPIRNKSVRHSMVSFRLTGGWVVLWFCGWIRLRCVPTRWVKVQQLGTMVQSGGHSTLASQKSP